MMRGRGSDRLKFGTECIAGGVRFRLWAPLHETIGIELDGRALHCMTVMPDGWHEFMSTEARPGSHYRFVLPDGRKVPDPASRFQPMDVHGPSEVIDPGAYRWRTTA